MTGLGDNVRVKNLYLLLPPSVLADPTKHKESAAVVLAGYQALWHPKLLSDAERPPGRRDLNDLPEGADDLLCVPRSFLADASELIRKDLDAMGQRVLLVADDQTGLAGPDRILEPLNLPGAEKELLRDFYALGYAYFGLDLMFEAMGHENPVDEWSLIGAARQAADAFLEDDIEATRSGLQSAFDLLLTARQTVYPATINLLDLALTPPGLTHEDLQVRLAWQVPVNLILSGSELREMAERDPSLAEALRAAVTTESLEVLGGAYDQRPWSLLPWESRFWQLDRSATAYEEFLGSAVESFGARTAVLTPDLAQTLMKFQHRYALHAAFDASRLPHFRDPKLHWTAPDGSVIEALARVARDAGNEQDVFGVLSALADTLMNDRSATLVLAHWLNRSASWLHWMFRVHRYASVFGKFETFSDYFLNSSTPDRPTHTRVDEYHSNALVAAVKAGQPDPIGRWVDHHHLRGRLDASRSLVALHQIATGKSPSACSDIEDAIETGADDALQQLESLETEAMDNLCELLLADAPAGRGFLVCNPCSFPRRVCLDLPETADNLALRSPVRALQPTPEGSAVVLDLPAWGYAWIERGSQRSESAPRKATPLASGKRLRNEFLEVEIDGKTGGIRGVRETRSGYSRIGQQLCHGAGSRSVCKRLEVTSKGPAYGEIVTEGELRDAAGKSTLATFRQRTRVWVGRPFVGIDLRIDPVVALAGSPDTDYLACRWAWPDEKTFVAPASGFLLQGSRGADFEAPQLVELRERKLITDLLPHGLPFHHRDRGRMLDTLLVVAGERRRDFTLSLAFDLAHPWSAVYDALWPVSVRAVEQGPPTRGQTGWLASIDSANVLCTRLTAFRDEYPGVQLRLVETNGAATRAQLRFAKDPQGARLTNFCGQLIFDLHPSDDAIPVDFSPYEVQQIEVTFAQ